MTQPADLATLIADPAAVAAHWGLSHAVWKQAVDPAAFITRAEIERCLDASLLRWPYFALLRNGEQPAASTYTVTRDVIGQKRGGFPDGPRIRELMRSGASLKLNQLSDWHRPTREIQALLERSWPVAATAYAFWTPAESRGMLPHRDAAHVLAIQLEGRKEWHLYAAPLQIGSSAGLDVDAGTPSHTLLLEPGDLLYLPHGWPHDACARDGSSLHLTFTLSEPTPEDLIEALLSDFIASHHALVHRHHARALDQKAREVRDALFDHVGALGQDAWLALALSAKRQSHA